MVTKRTRRGTVFAAAAIVIASCNTKPVPPVYPNAVTLDQGPKWGPEARGIFYSDDQGSRLIPLSWMQALKQSNGQPFASDSFSRYGYLPNPPSQWPVGFTTGQSSGIVYFGMTCAACHTRQIIVKNVPYRIDGGPAIVDFQHFLSDLDDAAHAVATDGAAFADFAQSVLGHAPSPAERTQLLNDVQAWYGPYHTLMRRALPPQPWGLGRLDAVGMIFNRVTGLDIGSPDRVIAENIRPADAPVRYPFLWNAPIQDKTQWPGFLDNGNDLLALARNIGEVNGVFSMFHPVKMTDWPGINYQNSVNIQGLLGLEDRLKNLQRPKWPFNAADPKLVARGATLFSQKMGEKPSCADCHDQKPGIPRFFHQATWQTPLIDVGTDTREYNVLAWTASSGVLNGASIRILNQTLLPPLQPIDKSVSIVGFSVVGSILSNSNLFDPTAALTATSVAGARSPMSSPAALRELSNSFARARTQQFNLTATTAAPAQHVYEARVLWGIWAAAPYLHNGSVPTLADLLKPAANRPASFAVGPAYDIDRVGLATDQTALNSLYQTTDCSDLNSGNSRCGHEYGTDLSDGDKRALLEYLKTL